MFLTHCASYLRLIEHVQHGHKFPIEHPLDFGNTSTTLPRIITGFTAIDNVISPMK